MEPIKNIIHTLLLENINFKDISDAQYDWATEYLNHDTKDWNTKDFGYYLIDVSGKYSVYYTLWRYKPSKSAHVKPIQYIQNLSTDFKKAIEKAKIIANVVPTYIDKTGTKSSLHGQKAKFTFGKYRGELFGDVFVKDPQYFAWVYKNLYGGLSKQNRDFISHYNNLYWENKTKENIENSISSYLGKKGEKISVEGIVKKIKNVTGQFGDAKQYNLEDLEGNKIMVYGLEKLYPDVKISDQVKFTGTVANHYDVVGIKHTYINRIKLL